MTEETATGMALRAIRNEIIEQCAKVCDELRRRDYSAETEDWIAGTADCARALRALVSTQPERGK
jgi:hypothetical protein